MTPEELADRLARIEEQAGQTRDIFQQHILVEEARFEEIAANVKELRDVFLGARGVLKVAGWAVAGLASVAAVWTWVVQHFALR